MAGFLTLDIEDGMDTGLLQLLAIERELEVNFVEGAMVFAGSARDITELAELL